MSQKYSSVITRYPASLTPCFLFPSYCRLFSPYTNPLTINVDVVPNRAKKYPSLGLQHTTRRKRCLLCVCMCLWASKYLPPTNDPVWEGFYFHRVYGKKEKTCVVGEAVRFTWVNRSVQGKKQKKLTRRQRRLSIVSSSCMRDFLTTHLIFSLCRYLCVCICTSFYTF